MKEAMAAKKRMTLMARRAIDAPTMREQKTRTEVETPLIPVKP